MIRDELSEIERAVESRISSLEADQDISIIKLYYEKLLLVGFTRQESLELIIAFLPKIFGEVDYYEDDDGTD